MMLRVCIAWVREMLSSIRDGICVCVVVVVALMLAAGLVVLMVAVGVVVLVSGESIKSIVYRSIGGDLYRSG